MTALNLLKSVLNYNFSFISSLAINPLYITATTTKNKKGKKKKKKTENTKRQNNKTHNTTNAFGRNMNLDTDLSDKSYLI